MIKKQVRTIMILVFISVLIIITYLYINKGNSSEVSNVINKLEIANTQLANNNKKIINLNKTSNIKNYNKR